MLHRSIMLSALGLGSLMTSGIARMADDGETLGLIELDTNLADVEKPLELPAGNYTGEIQDVQIGTSQKGNRYFNIKFHIAPEEIPGDVAEQFEDGANLFYNRILVPDGKDRRALFNMKTFVETLGLETGTTSIDPNEWMGCKARLKVVHGTWQGESRAEIKSLSSAEAPAPKVEAKKTARGGRK